MSFTKIAKNWVRGFESAATRTDCAMTAAPLASYTPSEASQTELTITKRFNIVAETFLADNTVFSFYDVCDNLCFCVTPIGNAEAG